MHREGHYGMALLVYAPVAFLMLALDFSTLALAGGVVVVGGAMIPDLDLRVPGVTHRGPTHTIWFALGFGGIVATAGVMVGWSRGPLAALGTGVFGALVGTLTVVAHILADVLTPTGVRPFAPVRDETYTLDAVKAANPIANYALLGVGVLAGVLAFVAGASL